MFLDCDKHMFLVAGPCSVESREQLFSVVQALQAVPQVGMIRAGVWKPRTRPGGFEGLGEPALRWIAEVHQATGMAFCCEVVVPAHVSLCQQYGVDTVWLGARTTANPIMVEEICHALAGCEMNVMVKNPVCPDASLWIGAVERVQKAGVRSVAAVHRGFSMYNNFGYRNAPLWEVPLKLRSEMPDLPILCDPSHIAGRRDLVPSVAAAAVALDYNGLMVEVHPTPECALTDAAQQLSPTQFATMVAGLESQGDVSATPSHSQTDSTLVPLRRQIDDIDHELLQLLAQRMQLSRRIAEVKRGMHLSVYQHERWATVMADRVQLATQLGLDEAFTRELLEKIHAESVRVQMP